MTTRRCAGLTLVQICVGNMFGIRIFNLKVDNSLNY